MTRRHVLGELYGRCDALTERIPVYLAGLEPELLGHVDEALGHYADAFSFHLGDDVCKKLAAGHFTYTFDFTFTDAAQTGTRSRVKLNSITLTGRKGYEKPVAKSLLKSTDLVSTQS